MIHIPKSLLWVGIPVLLALLVLVFRYDQEQGQWVEGLHMNLVTDPREPVVGENLLRTEIKDKSNVPVADARVIFKYFEVPPAYMIPQKDPVATASASYHNDAYEASVYFKTPGTWKVAVEIMRQVGGKPKVIVAWFTLKVQETSSS